MTGDLIRGYLQKLVRAEIVAPVGYGKGLPVFRPWGLAIARKVIDLFVEQFGHLDKLNIRHPSMLIASEEYDSGVEDFGGYDNVYRVKLGARAFVLRPDAALDNLRCAMNLCTGDGGASVLAVFHGTRSVKGATPALYRDRGIWPFVQLNRIVPAASCDSAVNAMLQALLVIFDKLCLPVRMIRVGQWKNYARDRYDGVLITPGGEPTILSMLFVVGETYRRLAGIPDDMEAFDLGFTEKAIAAMVLMHGCDSEFILPPSVAPIAAIVASDTGDWPEPVCPADRAISTLVERSDPDWWRVWRRRGVPLIIDSARGRLRMKMGTAAWIAWDPQGLTMREALRRQQAELMAAAEQRASIFTNSLYRGLCIRCIPENTYTGEATPPEAAVCSGGESARLRFVGSGSQIY